MTTAAGAGMTGLSAKELKESELQAESRTNDSPEREEFQDSETSHDSQKRFFGCASE